MANKYKKNNNKNNSSNSLVFGRWPHTKIGPDNENEWCTEVVNVSPDLSFFYVFINFLAAG